MLIYLIVTYIYFDLNIFNFIILTNDIWQQILTKCRLMNQQLHKGAMILLWTRREIAKTAGENRDGTGTLTSFMQLLCDAIDLITMFYYWFFIGRQQLSHLGPSISKQCRCAQGQE